MSVQLAYSDDDHICHLLALGETTLPDLHVALDRQIDQLPEAAAPRILVDMRETVLETTAAEVEMFIAFLQLRVIPHLDDRAGAMAMLTGVDAEIESSPMHDTCSSVSALVGDSDRLRIVQSLDDARTALIASPSAI